MFTSEETKRLSRIYNTACRDGPVVINCIRGNIYWRLRDTPERKELTKILRGQFPSWFHIDWDLVEEVMDRRNVMTKPIERFIKDEITSLIRAEDNVSGIKHDDIDHYRGVIAGKRIAYKQVLEEIRRLRRLP